MKKFFLIISSILFLVSCGGSSETDEPKVSVQCVTGNATDITHVTASVSGAVSVSGTTSGSIQAAFYYSTASSDAKTLAASGKKVPAGSLATNEGTFSASFNDLEPSTTYFYVASVTVGGQPYYGSVKSFTTAEKPKELSITGTATDITECSAVINSFANPTPEMGNIKIGIVYSTEESPSLSNGVVLTSEELDNNNMYSIVVQNLASNTAYYYKAFVQYGGVYRYGEVKSFTTLEVTATLETLEATEVALAGATLNGQLNVVCKGSLSKEVWFLYSTSASTLEELKSNGIRSKSTLSEDGSLKSELVMLESGTVYYYVAYAKIHDKDFFGEVKQFTTTAIEVSITTEDVENLIDFNVRFRATVSVKNNGGDPIFVKFYYSEKYSDRDNLYTKGYIAKATISEDGVYEAVVQLPRVITQYHVIACAEIYDKLFFGEIKTVEAKGYTVNSKWSISYNGRENFEGAEVDRIVVKSSDNNSYYIDVLSKASFDNGFKGNLNDYFTAVHNNLEADVKAGNAKWSDLLGTRESYVLFDRLRAGEWKAFAIGFDSEGNLTGQYAVLDFVIQEEKPTPEFNNWLGTWKIGGKDLSGNNVYYTITLSSSEANYAYWLSGWEPAQNANETNYEFEVMFNPENNHLEFNSVYFETVTFDDGDYEVCLNGNYKYNGKYYYANEDIAIADGIISADGKTAEVSGCSLTLEMSGGKTFNTNFTSMQLMYVPVKEGGTTYVFNSNVPQFPLSMEWISVATKAATKSISPIKSSVTRMARRHRNDRVVVHVGQNHSFMR